MATQPMLQLQLITLLGQKMDEEVYEVILPTTIGEISVFPSHEPLVTLAKPGENCNINEITRVSKPGRRVYVASADIPKVKSGRGMVLVSTSKGVMTGQEAVKNKLGGEVLLKVY